MSETPGQDNAQVERAWLTAMMLGGLAPSPLDRQPFVACCGEHHDDDLADLLALVRAIQADDAEGAVTVARHCDAQAALMTAGKVTAELLGDLAHLAGELGSDECTCVWCGSRYLAHLADR